MDTKSVLARFEAERQACGTDKQRARRLVDLGDDHDDYQQASANRATVQVPTTSGDAIEAWVYLPEGSGPHLVVVMTHGIKTK
jgi:dipeptidyl aminopeptidase/acylaminoacyl peptidase